MDGRDAREDEGDPVEELLAVVVPPRLVRDGALGEFEQAMFTRGDEAATDGTQLYELMFGEDTPRGLIAMFTGAQPAV